MVQRRALTLLSLAGVATLALASCSGGGSPSPEGDGPIDLRMTVWTADEGHLALFDEIAQEYIDANPERVASVTFETVPFEDYTTTLTTQLAGGNTPDLAWIFESSAPEFVQSGALTDLEPTLQEAEGYEYDDIVPSALDLWSHDDGVYAYPFSNSPFALFVNTDRIAEAGQEDPAELVASGDWTFDEARDVAAATADELGGAGLVVRDFDFSDWTNLSTVWGGWGASPWSADGATCSFTDPEMTDAMSWIHDAVFQEGAMPSPGTSADFFAGDATMSITQISRAAALDGSFEWDIVPLPAGPEGQQNVIGQAGIGVFQNGQSPEVAADFLAHFTSPASAEKLASFFPPPRQSLLSADVLAEANPLLSEQQLESVVVQGIEGAVTKPAHANFAQLQTAIRGELDALWQADADVESVLADVCSAADPLLEG